MEENTTEFDTCNNGEIRGSRCFDRPLLSVGAHTHELLFAPAQQMPKINKHSLTNCKIQILWQSAKSNQEETAPLVSVCGLQQTLLMRFFFFFHQICSHSFLPSYFPPKQRARASIAKALSGLGLILRPKCFTASVITSS